MDVTVPVFTKTIFTQATVAADGSLHLDDELPVNFKPGEKVAVIISPMTNVSEENPTPLKGTVSRYDDPFEPAVPLDEWEVLG